MDISRAAPAKSILLLPLLWLLLPLAAVSATTWYVDAAVSASGDGQSWPTAKKTIQEAVDSAASGDQVWVAEGVYFEHVTLDTALSLYGGFAGTETAVEQRDLSVHQTILDGNGETETALLFSHLIWEIDIDGFNTRNTGIGADLGSTSGRIRNCRFTNSSYSGAHFTGVSWDIEKCYFLNNIGTRGCGLTAWTLVCNIRNCVFEGNVSSGSYGAIYFPQGGKVDMSSCIIRNNAVQGRSAYGVGMTIYGGKATIDRCVITGNTGTEGSGGGILSTGKLTITNCLIADNANYAGGGVWASAVGGASISNCMIVNNRAVHGGGIWCNGGYSGSPIFLTNCTFAGNVATWEGDENSPPGGGVYFDTYTDPYLPPPPRSDLFVTNTVFSANTPNAIGYDWTSFLWPKNNVFHGSMYAVQTKWDNYATGPDLNNFLPGALDNVDGDPAFVDVWGKDYHLLLGSAAIDRGTTVGLTADFDGSPRPVDVPGVGADGTGEEFDIGAYEFQYPAVYSPALGQVCDTALPVRWTPSRLPGADVAVSLYRGAQWLREIAASTPNDGELIWPIAAGVDPGDAYQAGAAGGDTPTSVQLSNAFSIVLHGRPALLDARDDGGGQLRLDWDVATPVSASADQFVGFAYDGYQGDWVPRGAGGTPWFLFPSAARTGLLDVFHTGPYYAWISGQWADGAWLPCADPRTQLVYSGTPHHPRNFVAKELFLGYWRLHWTPEVYGTWLDQIIVWQNGVGWITPTDGPSKDFPQFAPWTFLDYAGEAYGHRGSFFNGYAYLTLPAGSSFVFFLNFRAWDAVTQGEFAIATSP